MARKDKRKHLYTKKEFFFNFFSLIIMIGIGVYFGYRSIYYYSKQNIAHEGNNQNLSDVVINSNKLITKGDGFHRDKEGYFFKGNINNNYVSFANRMFRIIRINTDGSIKLISNDIVTSFMWGDDSSYEKSNLRNWLEKTNEEHSGTYYDTIPSIDKFLIKTDYSVDTLEDEKVTKSGEIKSDYVTTLSLNDYILANGKNSYLNNNKIYYLLGKGSDKSNLYIEDDGTIAESDDLTGYGVRVVITLKKNSISLHGDGSIDNPYTIDQGKNTNYVDSIVKLGNDTWKVYKEENNSLQLIKIDYINNNDNEFKYHFSEKNNSFDLEDWKGLATYLNNNYLNSLSYKNILENKDYYIGEISSDTGYSYQNIYKDKITCKVGLLNMFDYDNTSHDDFYLVNTLQGEMQYIKYKNGLLGEAEMTEEKHIVPVISISKNVIKSGKGTKDNPYIMG